MHFIDMPEIGKVRPVVILDKNGDDLVAVVAKITSKQPEREASEPFYEIREWQSKGLRKSSFVRLDQRLLLPHGDLLREKPLGRFSNFEFEQIRRRVEALLD